MLAAIVALAAFALLAATMDGVALTWDEPAYMASAQAYGEWLTVLGRETARLQPWRAFDAAVLAQYWNQPPLDLHPPLGKIPAAISWRLLRDVVDPFTAFRLGNAAVSAALVGLVFLMACELAGVAAGLVAGACLLAMPRFFFHSHLTELDVPVSFAWLLVVYVFWRLFQQDGQRSVLPAALLSGLAFGLALGVKNTGFLIPAGLAVWLVLFRRTRAAAVALASMVAIGAIVFILSWPWLYPDLPGRLAEYVQRVTLDHYDIPQYYLGSLHMRPPWHYPFVIAAAVVPITILLLALIGLGRTVVGGQAQAGGWLVAINAAVPLAFFSLIAAQAYGGERLFMPAFPFLAILAGLGFALLLERLGLVGRTSQGFSLARQGPLTVRVIGGLVLAGLALQPGVVGIVSYSPHQLSYFNELAGGLAGADAAGFEVTYWCDTYQDTLPFLNAQAEQGAAVWTEEDGVLDAYQKTGRLRSDLQVGGRVVQAGPLAADYALIQRRPSGFTSEMESIMLEKQPVFTVRQGQTPLAYVYRIK